MLQELQEFTPNEDVLAIKVKFAREFWFTRGMKLKLEHLSKCAIYGLF
jgi:hypothetical protein